VNTSDLRQIDWAEVARRARADLGDERIARTSERVRTTMLAIAAVVRAGDSEGFRPKKTPPMSGELAID
jgi:hypothetical protein